MKAKKKKMSMYAGGGKMEEMMMLKKYMKGGKMTKGCKAMFEEKPELKEKFG